MPYHVYLLRCEGGELYVGITTDLDRRFAEHAAGGPKGARYTRTHKPLRFEATWEMPDRASASALEYRLKRCSHDRKQAIAETPTLADSLIAESLEHGNQRRVTGTAGVDIIDGVADIQPCA